MTVTNAAGIVYNRGHRAKSAHSIEKFPLPIQDVRQIKYHFTSPYQALPPGPRFRSGIVESNPNFSH